jgi:hypothetical protein
VGARDEVRRHTTSSRLSPSFPTAFLPRVANDWWVSLSDDEPRVPCVVQVRAFQQKLAGELSRFATSVLHLADDNDTDDGGADADMVVGLTDEVRPQRESESEREERERAELHCDSADGRDAPPHHPIL